MVYTPTTLVGLLGPSLWFWPTKKKKEEASFVERNSGVFFLTVPPLKPLPRTLVLTVAQFACVCMCAKKEKRIEKRREKRSVRERRIPSVYRNSRRTWGIREKTKKKKKE